MANILCIETATVNCSVAVFVDGELKSIRESNTGGYSHSENLHVYIKEVIDEAGIGVKGIDAVAVSRGPGSYTGLRIGVSAAKGLAYALGVPLVAVDTLKLMAISAQKNTKADLYIPMIDARRMEVYSAVYDTGMDKVRDVEAVVVDEDSYSFLPEDKVVCFCGDGMNKCREVIKHACVNVCPQPTDVKYWPLAEQKDVQNLQVLANATVNNRLVELNDTKNARQKASIFCIITAYYFFLAGVPPTKSFK